MIDLKQIGAIQENYLKERWIRMNWRKNYRKQMAEKLKFRSEEIEEAKRVIGEKEISEDKPSDIPLEDIESTKSKIIKIPTEQSHTPDAPPETLSIRSVSRASRTSSRAAAPSRATPTVTSRAATSRADSNGSRLSVRSKSDHSEKLQRLQSPKVIIPQADLKPTEIIRQQINSASRTGRRSSKDYPTRPKSTHYSTKGSNMVLSGTQISLNDRQNLWKSSAKMNLNSPRTTKTFLRARTTLGPEDKYEYPFVSSFNYGWRLNDHIKEYKPADHGRSQLIQSTFYRGNTAFMTPHSLY